MSAHAASPLPFPAGKERKPIITLAQPYPLLDRGTYIARCAGADFAWTNRWKKWIAKLDLDPQGYTGPRYAGTLCKLLQLGTNRNQPHAGPQSEFRQLLVEANGDQPPSLEIDEMSIFIGRLYDIQVEIVKTDRNGKPRLPVHWYSVVREIHVHKGE
jgi:hypothetical protein